MPINKPWIARDGVSARDLPGTVGAYELADANGDVIYIGCAGGRSLFGLRGALLDHCSPEEPNPVIRSRLAAFRYEVNANYLLRRIELLSRFREDNERLPAGNEASGEALPPLARYRWSPGG